MLAASIILAIIVSDQLTKLWVVDNFRLFESREIIPGLFSLTYITNSGAAFGFLNGDYGIWRQIFFVVVALAALCFMLVSLRQLRKEGKVFVVAISLIAGGACGNLIDRLRLGSVVDFLDFYIKDAHWPAFNVADSAITVGVAVFLLGHFMHSPKNDKKSQ